MAEEESLNKITSLLERGGTMLAEHHGCGAPLFRYRGEVVCPVCSFKDKGEERTGEEISSAVRERSSPSQAPAGGAGRDAGPVEVRPSPSIRLAAAPDIAAGAVAPAAPAGAAPSGDRAGVEEALRRAVLCRLVDITGALEVEGDPGRLRELLECADAALRVLRSLR